METFAKCHDPYTYAPASGFIGRCQKIPHQAKQIQYRVAIIWNGAFLRVVPNSSSLTSSQIHNEEPLESEMEPLRN